MNGIFFIDWGSTDADTVVCERTRCATSGGGALECYEGRSRDRRRVLHWGQHLRHAECARAARPPGLALWEPSAQAYPRIYYFGSGLPCSRFWSGWTQRMKKGKWISWAMELQFIAQAGVLIQKDRFDLERI